MAISRLYEMCVRKVDINLRDGFYEPWRENPFSNIPSTIVDDIASSVLERQNSEEFRAQDLEQLLTSGNITKLRIWVTTLQTWNALLREALRVLNLLRTGCQKLVEFHLSLFTRDPHEFLLYAESDGFLAADFLVRRWRRDIAEALGDLIRSSPNLEDFHCSLSFDLKALRSCQKLRTLRLHFEPEQRWHEFLEEENGHLKTHESLQLFSVCGVFESKRVRYDDVAIILRNCPNLTSLGFLESMGALSQLHSMDIPCELKLKCCYWAFFQQDRTEYHTQIREAVKKCPMIEELEFEGCCLSVPYLKELKNLVYLEIHLDANVSDIDFNNLLLEIGPQLKHLCFHTNTSMDISFLLQNCMNLESLRIDVEELTTFTNPFVRLPKLQYLSLENPQRNAKEIFNLLRECINLTELFLFNGVVFNDETLNSFLCKNFLSNLKVAYFESCELTEDGFGQFLQNTPNLEKVSMNNRDTPRRDLENFVSRMNRNVLCIGNDELKKEEFFEKRGFRC